MSLAKWAVLINSLFDHDGKSHELISGPNIEEWLLLAFEDFDETDRMRIDEETQGGG